MDTAWSSADVIHWAKGDCLFRRLVALCWFFLFRWALLPFFFLSPQDIVHRMANCCHSSTARGKCTAEGSRNCTEQRMNTFAVNWNESNAKLGALQGLTARLVCTTHFSLTTSRRLTLKTAAIAEEPLTASLGHARGMEKWNEREGNMLRERLTWTCLFLANGRHWTALLSMHDFTSNGTSFPPHCVPSAPEVY